MSSTGAGKSSNNRLYYLLAATLGGAVIGFFTSIIKPASPFPWSKLPPWLMLDPSLPAFRPYLVVCIVVWCLFAIFWEAAAKNAGEAKSSESRFSRLIHVLPVNVALLIEFLPIVGFGRFMPVMPVILILGVALEMTGLLLAIWSRVHLGRNWSGAISVKVEHQLIRTGPYRLLRHPIYTGLMMMYLGPVLVTGEWHAWIGIAMAALAYWRKIRLEEAVLNGAFGIEYENYRRDTWALVPGIY